MTTVTLRATLLALLVALAAATPALSQNALDRSVRKDYTELEKLLKGMGGEMKDAERRAKMGGFQAACRRFVDKYKGDSARLTTGHFDMARAHIHLADPSSARPHLEKFLSLHPKHADSDEAYLLLGDAHRAVNETDKAVALYRQFLAQRPGSDRAPYARIGLGMSLMLTMQHAEAIAQFRQLIDQHPEHELRADAELQLVEANVDSGDFAAARTILDELLAKNPEAAELQHRREIVGLLGTAAKDLTGILGWVGVPGRNVKHMQGQVLVLCFFMNWSLPCTQELQFLSSLQGEFDSAGLAVWGITKNYKAKAKWPVEKEIRWLDRYRDNPRFVIEKELPGGNASQQNVQKDMWVSLEKPIRVPFAVTNTFDNHRGYNVRGVPCVVVIDKTGIIRMIKEGGAPPGGYQRQLIRKTVKGLLSE